jgi:hypothetical protein
MASSTSPRLASAGMVCSRAVITAATGVSPLRPAASTRSRRSDAVTSPGG